MNVMITWFRSISQQREKETFVRDEIDIWPAVFWPRVSHTLEKEKANIDAQNLTRNYIQCTPNSIAISWFVFRNFVFRLVQLIQFRSEVTISRTLKKSIYCARSFEGVTEIEILSFIWIFPARYWHPRSCYLNILPWKLENSVVELFPLQVTT